MIKNISSVANIVIFFLLTLLLIAIPFLHRYSYCPDCSTKNIQVFCLIGATLGFLLNINVGSYSIHIGIILLNLLLGGAPSLFQLSKHICPYSPTFGIPFCGLSMYTWFVALFGFMIVCVAGILMIPINYIKTKTLSKKSLRSINAFGFFAILTNCVDYFLK